MIRLKKKISINVIVVFIVVAFFTNSIYSIAAVKATAIIKLSNTNENTITVKLKKVSGVDGYQITYATNNDFTKGKKNTVTKSTTKAITSLKKGTTYYVKARPYSVGVKDKIAYGKYCSVKKIKITKGGPESLVIDQKVTGKLKAGDSHDEFKIKLDTSNIFGFTIKTKCNKGNDKIEWIITRSDGFIWSDYIDSSSVSSEMVTDGAYLSYTHDAQKFFTGEYTYTISAPEYLFYDDGESTPNGIVIEYVFWLDSAADYSIENK